MKKHTNPGSIEAKNKGCKCPQTDNGRGLGAFVDDKGKPVFWINKDCPLHGEINSANS